MYVLLKDKKSGILYIDIPPNPTLSIVYEDEYEAYVAYYVSTTSMTVLCSGDLSECNLLVNKIIAAVGSTPIDIQNS